MNTLHEALLHRFARAYLAKPGLALALGVLGGCSSAPALVVAGAYVPAWLVCTLFGMVVGVVARAWMLRRGYARTLPLQLGVYAALSSMVALLVWYIWVGV